LNITEAEFDALCMCKTFAEHLIGKGMFEEASRGIEKNQGTLSRNNYGSLQHFDSFRSGSIDYTPHQETIRKLIDAMNDRNICRVTYKSILETKAKIFYIKPLKIFSHNDSVYLHAQLAKTPGKKYVEPKFDPILAIHRIKSLNVTERLYVPPANYDFDKVFKQNFGLIKEDAVEVEIEFTGYFEKYVAERIWSPNQSIRKKNGKKILKFYVSSKPELISWVLSFGEDAKVLKPEWLINSVKKKIEKIQQQYK
jgi:predicted DNA-binding transcriptional regulator YafY